MPTDCEVGHGLLALPVLFFLGKGYFAGLLETDFCQNWPDQLKEDARCGDGGNHRAADFSSPLAQFGKILLHNQCQSDSHSGLTENAQSKIFADLRLGPADNSSKGRSAGQTEGTAYNIDYSQQAQ